MSAIVIHYVTDTSRWHCGPLCKVNEHVEDILTSPLYYIERPDQTLYGLEYQTLQVHAILSVNMQSESQHII